MNSFSAFFSRCGNQTNKGLKKPTFGVIKATANGGPESPNLSTLLVFSDVGNAPMALTQHVRGRQ